MRRQRAGAVEGGHPVADMDDFNRQVIEEFRSNGGVVGGPFAGSTVLLLTTTGARSGRTRVTPVVSRTEDGDVFVFASKAGAPTHPDWFHNLVANPSVTVELGTDTYPATAEVLEGAERDRVYAAQAEQFPNFAEYQAATDRVIPVVRLVRT
jgi:deazaflavin-dependent oxidoreductase (nitroreductase family)